MKTLLATALLAAALTSAQAQLVVWDFNDNVVTPAAVENLTVGNPTITLSGSGVDNGGTTGTAFTDEDGTLHAAGTAGRFLADAGNDNQVLISFNNTGFAQNVLRFDYRSTSTDDFAIRTYWRVGGEGAFNYIGESNLLRDGEWHTYPINLFNGDIYGASNVEILLTTHLVGVRGNHAFDIDNVQMTAVPEPAASASVVGGALLLAGVVWRRRFHAKALAK